MKNKIFLDPAGMVESLFLVIASIIVMTKYKERYKMICQS